MPFRISSKTQLWTELANNLTYERRRAEHMGFKFSAVELVPTLYGWRMAGSFTCICGREEYYRIAVPEDPKGQYDLDPALWLRGYGSFDRKHLLADGYSEEEVSRIEGLGREFDRANGLPKIFEPWPGAAWEYGAFEAALYANQRD